MRLLIGRLNARGKLISSENFREAVRLGTDVFSTGQIEEKTMQLAIKALGRFRYIMDQHGASRCRAVATSALREAANTQVFLARVASECRIDLEVISAEEEVRYVYAAAAQAVGFPRGYSILIDIGGGSVEVSLISDSQIIRSESYQLGTVRLLQLFQERTHNEELFVRLVSRYVRAIRRELRRELGDIRISRCIVTGGNVESLGDLRVSRLGASGNMRLKSRELNRLIEILASMNPERRAEKLGLRPDRADVILPAALVLQQILKEIKLKEMRIPHVGVKDGVLLDCLASFSPSAFPAHRREVLAFAKALGRRYRYDRLHSEIVASLAAGIFDATRSLHKLGEHERLLLELAAVLHDIGHFVGVNGHHKHSYYLINASPFVGLSAREKKIVATVVRYHRKAHPAATHPEFSALNASDRQLVLQLAAMLRIADALDSEHTGEAPALSFKLGRKAFQIRIGGSADSQLERWSVIKKGRLFEEVFKLNLEVR